MTASARSWQQDDHDRFVETLRDRYEHAGFVFTAHPAPGQLPEFLGSYVPDAVAEKPGLKVAIEVKHRLNASAERTLSDIRRLFDGHPDWQFRVVLRGADPLQSVPIAPASRATLHARLDEVRALAAQGHRRSAFVMAWSLLEAALRFLDGASCAHAPGTVVQTLAMNGHIEPEIERRVRGLVDLRNRIVHGDLAAEPSLEDIASVLSAIEQSLSVEMS